MKRVDLVTVTSQRLYELKKGKARRVELVLNAGDVSRFSRLAQEEPRDLRNIGRPRLGMVGALDAYKIDFDMLLKLAQAKPDWQLVFIGEPVVEQSNDKLNQLRKLPNVHVLGPRSSELVPPYVYSFDVCLIPYRQSRYNEASFPLKFWEFMATGKPIVASGVPELKKYQHLIGYAEEDNELIKKIEEALLTPQLGEKKRKELTREHSWEKRTARLLELLDDTIQSKRL